MSTNTEIKEQLLQLRTEETYDRNRLYDIARDGTDDLELAKLIIDVCVEKDIDIYDYPSMFCANINTDPEIFEYYVKTTKLEEAFEDPEDLFFEFNVEDSENAMKNFETLAKYAPSAFENEVAWRNPSEGDSTSHHYLAELHHCDNDEISAKILSHTPTKVLKEILMCSLCRNSTFEMIRSGLKTR